MDPQLYFMQLLMNLPAWSASDIDAWLPDRWKQAHAARCEALEIPLSIPENRASRSAHLEQKQDEISTTWITCATCFNCAARFLAHP